MNAIELTTTAQLMVSQFNVAVELKQEHDSKDFSAFTRHDEHKGYRVTLPALDCEYKPEALSWLRGYLDHEIGHVLYSDFDAVSTRGYREAGRILKNNNLTSTAYSTLHSRLWQIWGRCLNIVEDGRIEQLMAKAFPGSGGNLRWLNDKLFTEEKYIEASDNIIAMEPSTYCQLSNTPSSGKYGRSLQTDVALTLTSALFALRWYIYHPNETIPKLIVENTAVSKLEYTREACDIARCAASARTQEEACCYATELLRLVANIMVDHADDMLVPEEDAEILRGGGLDAEPDLSSQTGMEQLANAAKSAATVAGQLTDMAGKAFDVLSGKDTGTAEVMERTGENNTAQAHALQEVSECFEMYRRSEEECRAMPTDMYAAIEAVKYQSYGVLSSTLQTVTYQRARTGNIGTRLDARFLSRPSQGDGRIFTRRAERIALDANVSLVLDLSGSMRMAVAGQKTMAQLATEVAQGMMRALDMLPHVTASLYGYNGAAVAKLDRDSWMYATSMTPTGGALNVAYIESVKSSPKARQVMFLLTDGEPSQLDVAVSVSRMIRSKGVELYGMLIGGRGGFMDQLVGEGNHVAVENVRHFAGQLNHLMRKAIVRRAA